MLGESSNGRRSPQKKYHYIGPSRQLGKATIAVCAFVVFIVLLSVGREYTSGADWSYYSADTRTDWAGTFRQLFSLDQGGQADANTNQQHNHLPPLDSKGAREDGEQAQVQVQVAVNAAATSKAVEEPAANTRTTWFTSQRFFDRVMRRGDEQTTDSHRTSRASGDSSGDSSSDSGSDGPGCDPRSADDPCAESKNCDTGGMINYLGWYYCGGAKWAKMTAFVVVLVLFFYMLGTVAEEFFCPTLSQIAELLHMSPDVAGITILALGNGAPDLFSSFAAVTQGQLPIALGALVGAGSFVTLVVVGAVALSANCTVSRFPFIRDVSGYLIGSSAVCAIVLSGGFHLWMAVLFLLYYAVYVGISIAVNVYNNRKVEELQEEIEFQLAQLAPDEKEEIDRFYSPSDAALDSSVQIRVYKPNEYPRVHVSRAVADYDDTEDTHVLIPDARHRDSSSSSSSDNDDNGDGDGDGDGSTSINGSRRESLLLVPSPRQSRLRSSSLLLVPSGSTPRATPRRSRNRSILVTSGEVDQGTVAVESAEVSEHYRDVKEDNTPFLTSPALDLSVQSPRRPSTLSVEEMQEEREEARRERRMRKFLCKVSCDRSMFSVPWRRLPSLFLRRIEWHDKAWYEKIGWCLVSPVTLAFNLTIPQIEEESWHKLMAVLNPTCAPLLICLATQTYDVSIGALPLVVFLMLIGAGLSVLIFFTTTSKLPKRNELFLIAAFLLSIIWIYIVANELVSLLQTLGYILNISPAILGLTVLAWGNSTGDLISDIVVAKQGFPEMALAATFGGPLFNMLLGLGISMIVVCSEIFPKAYPAEISPELAIGFSFLAIGLASTLMTVPYAGFVIPKKYAIYLIFIYTLESVLSVLVETGVIHF